MNIFKLSNIKTKVLSPWLIFSLILTGLITIQSCDTGTSGNSSSKATINVAMTDAPAYFKAVTVNVTEIDVHKNVTDSTSGWQTISSQPITVNLMELANGKTKLIGSNLIDAGSYNQIRLVLGKDNSVTTMDGVTHTLTVPSGSQTGIKISSNFTINGGQSLNLVLDFDASRSIHMTGNGNFMMKPVIHPVSSQTQGSVSGTVMPPSAKPVIFAINNQDTVSSTFSDTTGGNFKFVGLDAGNYDLAFNPTDTTYKDTTITSVQVMSGSDSQIDTVKFSKK